MTINAVTNRPFGSLTRRRVLAAMTALAGAGISRSALAQAWPQKPVRLLVGFAAGGNIDNVARLTATRLSDVLGHQFR